MQNLLPPLTFYDLYILKVLSDIEIIEVDLLCSCFLNKQTNPNKTKQPPFHLVKERFFHNSLLKKKKKIQFLFTIYYKRFTFYRIIFCTDFSFQVCNCRVREIRAAHLNHLIANLSPLFSWVLYIFFYSSFLLLLKRRQTLASVVF